MVSMMDEMQKTLARRRAKVERVEDVSRFFSSLLDNAPIYLVGCVIQKKWFVFVYNTVCLLTFCLQIIFFLSWWLGSFAPLFNEDGLLPWTKCDEWWNTENCRTPLDLINASKNLKISNNGTVSSTEEYWKWVWIWFPYFLLCFILILFRKSPRHHG